MQDWVHIISDSIPFATFLARRVEQVFKEKVETISSGDIVGRDGYGYVFLDHRMLPLKDVRGKVSWNKLREAYPNADFIVVGAESDEHNQYHVIKGARDFISSKMLTSGLFDQYLSKRLNQDWVGSIDS